MDLITILKVSMKHLMSHCRQFFEYIWAHTIPDAYDAYDYCSVIFSVLFDILWKNVVKKWNTRTTKDKSNYFTQKFRRIIVKFSRTEFLLFSKRITFIFFDKISNWRIKLMYYTLEFHVFIPHVSFISFYSIHHNLISIRVHIMLSTYFAMSEY